MESLMWTLTWILTWPAFAAQQKSCPFSENKSSVIVWPSELKFTCPKPWGLPIVQDGTHNQWFSVIWVKMSIEQFLGLPVGSLAWGGQNDGSLNSSGTLTVSSSGSRTWNPGGPDCCSTITGNTSSLGVRITSSAEDTPWISAVGLARMWQPGRRAPALFTVPS